MTRNLEDQNSALAVILVILIILEKNLSVSNVEPKFGLIIPMKIGMMNWNAQTAEIVKIWLFLAEGKRGVEHLKTNDFCN